MPREIKTTLSADGEQAYKRAIQEARKSISQMGSALSLATAQFKQDGDAMKLMESRSKTLRAEIDQQKVIVKSLEGALKDVTKQYGEDSKQAEKWQAELNRAQAKLVNLETELENNNKGLDKNGKAFESAGGKAQGFGNELSSLDKIQQSTTFQALNTALGNIQSGFQAALDKGKQFAGFVWNTAVESSNHYDDLATEALKLNVPVQTLRAWETASQLVDTETKDIAKSLVKLVNPSKQVSDALRDLGVRTTQYTGEYGKFGAIVGNRDTIDIYWDTIEAIGKLGTVQAQEAKANEIFGKSYQELLPLIKAGRAAWDEYVAKALETAPDEEAADKLTTFNDALVEYNRALTDFKDTISSGIAPGLTDLTKAGTDFLTEMTKWAQSPEGQEKLDKLSQAISDMVSSLATEGNFSKVVEGATTVVQGFTSALQWVIDNWKAVAIGIGTIALVSGAVKVGSGVLSFLAAIKEIQWLNVASGANALANAAGSGAAGGAAAASAAGGAAASAATGATVTSLISKAFSGAEAFVGALTSKLGLGGLAVLTGLPMIDFFKNPGKYLGDGERALKTFESLGADPLSGLEAGITKPETVKKGLWSLLGWGGEEAPQQTTGDPKRPKHITGTASPESMQGYVERTVEDIYEDLYKAINDYDPATNIQEETQFFDNVLKPLAAEAMQAGNVPLEEMDEIAALFRKKFLDSFEDDWEGTTGGLLNILQEAIDEKAQGVKLTLDPIIPDNAEELLQNQVGRITLQVAAVPVVGGGIYSRGENASRSYTSNSNLYVQNMNMNGSADVDGLADAIATRARNNMAGFGG